MKRLVVLATIALVPLLGCTPSAPPPVPTETLPPVQESASYLKDDPKVHGFLCRPDTKGTSPAVLLIHDHMGLTDAVKDEAFRLARDGYVALAIDLYRGQTPKTAKEAERLERALPKDRALGDVQAAVDYLSERPDVRSEENPKSKNLGVLGLGMGGVYALEAALRDPRLRAVVSCYSPLPTDAKLLKPLNASVFYIYAGKDKSVSADDLAKFCRAMQDAGKLLDRIREYGDCPYGFLDPVEWPIYSKPPEPNVRKTWESNVQEAWDLIARYFDKELS